jgi:hypothetical protein
MFLAQPIEERAPQSEMVRRESAWRGEPYRTKTPAHRTEQDLVEIIILGWMRGHLLQLLVFKGVALTQLIVERPSMLL